MFTEFFAFAAALVTLLGTPALAWVAARGLRHRTPACQRITLAGLCGIVIGVVTAASLGVFTSHFDINFIAACAAYAAFGVLALSAFRIRPKLIGAIAGLAASAPLLLGLLAGTIGILGLAFVVGDMVPIHVEQTALGVRCYVYSFGNATTSTGGFDVTLSRQVPVATFIEHLEDRQRFYEPSFSPSEACQQAILRQAG